MAHDISSQILGAVATVLDKDIDYVSREASLDSLGADDLDTIQIVMKLEELFSIEISDNDAENLTSVSFMVTYVQERVG